MQINNSHNSKNHACLENNQKINSEKSCNSLKSIFDFSSPELINIKKPPLNTFSMPSQSGNGKIDTPVSQGNIGDCSLISAITSIAATESGKKAISDSIKIVKDSNGTPLQYKITFKGENNYATISQEEVKKAQEFLYIETNKGQEILNFKRRYSAGDDDMTALELAMEKCFKTSSDPVLKKLVDSRQHSNKDTMTNVNPSCVSYLLTGELTEQYAVKENKNTDRALAEYNEYGKNNCKNLLNKAYSSNCENMIVFGNHNDTEIKDVNGEEITLFGEHAYAVTDVKENSLTLLNPWNTAQPIEVNKEDLFEFDGYTLFITELPKNEY